MKRFFLPVGLVLALVVGLLVPEPGAVCYKVHVPGLSLLHMLVIAIFLVSGYSLKRRDLLPGRRFLPLLTAAILINLFGGPLLALGVGHLLSLETAMYIGLVTMCCVPTTLSSCIVITGNAKGNVAAALMLNVSLLLLGVFVLPFTLGGCLNIGAAIQIDMLALLLKIGKLVLLPLVAGMGLKRLFGGRTHWLLKYIPSMAVVLTVWMALSSNHETLQKASVGQLLWIVLTVALVHGSMLLVAWAVRFPLRAERKDAEALLFVAAQKTLPLAITVLVALPWKEMPKGTQGVAMLVCVLFHFTQIIFDSCLATWRARVTEAVSISSK